MEVGTQYLMLSERENEKMVVKMHKNKESNS